MFLRLFFLFFGTTIILLGTIQAAPLKESSDQKAPCNKILVLIVASDEVPVYLELQKIWRAYMHLDPEHVEAYFIKANPDLATSCEVEGDIIWAKVPHGLNPGMTMKTLLAMELMLPRLKEFDYVVRTNLSSFFVFPKLFNFLDTLPKYGCYCAHIDGDPRYFITTWGCGAGIIFSPDIVELLSSEKETILSDPNVQYFNDDLVIYAFLQSMKIKLIPAMRHDILTKDIWDHYKEWIPENAFHFRVKNPHADLRITEDIYIHRELLKMFYPPAT